MRRLLSYLFLLAVLSCSWVLPGQAQPWTVSGTVKDSVTGDALAFVSIVINNSHQGGRTDIDGHFNISTLIKPEFLWLSYVGYAPKKVACSSAVQQMQILMAPVHYELSEVVIVPGENPAHRIIRKVIENRKHNDPEELPAFSCRSYNKITAEWIPGEQYYASMESWKTDSSKVDSSLIALVKSSETQHLLMMESYTRRIFMAPDKSKETILGNRVSGFKSPNFAPLATDVQPFSFYDPEINLNTGTVAGYQNPLGQGAVGRYQYILEDTLYENNDSIYVISFYPLKGKTFNGLKGIVYINTNGYAIQNIIATPAEEGLWSISIQQQYVFLNGKQWFPEQLNYEWLLPKYPNDKLGLLLKGRSYIDDINLEPGLKGSDFGPDRVLMSDSAILRDSLQWAQFRNDTLNSKEIRTYQYMDSLGQKAHLDYIMLAVPAMLDGFLPIGPLDWSFEKLYNFNEVEGHRLGLGVRTGEKIARWFTVGGYFGYGLDDEKFKYGGDLLFRLWKKHDVELYGKYRYDIQEPGLSSLRGFRNSSYWFGMIGKQFDFAELTEAGFRFRTFKFLEAEIALQQAEVSPLYDYYFQGTETSADSSFQFAELRAGLRYTVKDEITQAFGQRFSSLTRYPVLFTTYTRGISGFLNGDYDYSKLELGISQQFTIRNFGKMSLLAEAGKIWGSVPFPRMFRGRGSYGGDVSFFLRNSFQTMRTDEFVSDQYVSFFFTHNFGNFLFKTKNFKPEFTLAHNLMFGTIDHPEVHKNMIAKAPSKGFYEAGLIIDNIIRIKLLNIAYLGIGGGAFYRYGPYAFDTPIKNLTGKVSFRISGI